MISVDDASGVSDAMTLSISDGRLVSASENAKAPGVDSDAEPGDSHSPSVSCEVVY